MGSKDIGAEFIVRKSIHQESVSPYHLAQRSVHIPPFRFFNCCLLGEKKSRVKECGQEYILCLSDASSAVQRHASLSTL